MRAKVGSNQRSINNKLSYNKWTNADSGKSLTHIPGKAFFTE